MLKRSTEDWEEYPVKKKHVDTPQQHYNNSYPTPRSASKHSPEFEFINTPNLISPRLQCLLDNDNKHLPCKVISKPRIDDLRRQIFQLLYSLAMEFAYDLETVYMAMNYWDRYMTKVNANRRNILFLIGLGSLYLAGKLVEESREPLAVELAEFGNKLFECSYATITNIRTYERRILKELTFELSIVTPHAILDEILSHYGTPRVKQIKGILIEQSHPFLYSLMHTAPYCYFRPSVLAVSALYMVLQEHDYKSLHISVASLRLLMHFDEKSEKEYCCCLGFLSSD